MIRHLQDVAGLEPLQKIARDLGVVISATGDVARRLYTHELLTPSLPAPDLFDLTPFAAAIELVHSGGPELDDAVTRAIMRELTLPECFAWRIRSAKQDARAKRARSYGPMIPVHGVRLSTSGGFEDPMDARRDILSGVYRYLRNPLYRESPSFRANRDLEPFGAIEFLRTAAESALDLIAGDTVLAALQETFRDAMTWDTIARLQESAALRSKLHRLLRELCVASRTLVSRRVIERSDLRLFLGFVDGKSVVTSPAPAPAPSGVLRSGQSRFINNGAPPATFSADLEISDSSALTVSERILGDLSRLPQHIELVAPDALPVEGDGAALRTLTSADALADGIAPLRVSSWVRIMSGDARPAGVRALRTNEMIHFAYLDTSSPAVSPSAHADEDVSVLLLMRRGGESNAVIVAGPLAICTSHPYEMPNGAPARLLAFRLACGSAIEQAVNLDERSTAHIAFIVAARSSEEMTRGDQQATPVTVADEEDFAKNWLMRPIRYKDGSVKGVTEQYHKDAPVSA